jgi:hypothetical protein
MFVDEIEPEKPVILTRTAMHPEVEIRRHAQRCQNMPWRGYQQKNADHIEGAQSPPGITRKKPARQGQIDQRSADWNHQCNQAFQ